MNWKLTIRRNVNNTTDIKNCNRYEKDMGMFLLR